MKPDAPTASISEWPDALSGITSDGLLEAFRRELDGGIKGLRLEPMRGDASTRQYYRVRLSGGRRASAVLMALPEPCPPEAMDLPFLNVRAFLARLGLPVPAHHFSLPEHGIVVLEDFGDETLESGLQAASPAQAEGWYREAVESLVTMQLSQGDCCAFTCAFTPAKFEEELLFFLKHAVEGLWGRRLPSGDRAALTAEFRRLAEEVSPAAGPAVFTHRDYHSRNLMLLDNSSRLGILDFQDARLGPPTYDLASLVFDSYVALPHDLREGLVERYRLRREEVSGEKSDPEAFERALRLAAVQRNLKAVGTFAYQAHVLGRKRYLRSIGPTLAHVRDHFRRLPELRELSALLSPLFPETGRPAGRIPKRTA